MRKHRAAFKVSKQIWKVFNFGLLGMLLGILPTAPRKMHNTTYRDEDPSAPVADPPAGESSIDMMNRSLAEVSTFIREKYDPLNQAVGILGEENKRLEEAVKDILDMQRNSNRSALIRSQEDSTPRTMYKTHTGYFAWVDEIDIRILNAFFHASDADQEHLSREALSNLPSWGENILGVKKALDSTTAGAGDELVPTALLDSLWDDVNLMTAVKSLFPTIQMPTNPFDMPLQLGDVTWFRGTANVAATSSTLATAKKTLTAQELVAVVPWAYELDEDAVLAMLPELRSTLVRNSAEVMDDIILNGDTSDAGININLDAANSGDLTGAAGLDHYLSFDGLLKIPIVDNTGQGNDHNANVSDDMWNEIRGKMDRFGVRPSEMAFITDIKTYIRAQSTSNFRTLDKFGPQATILTGQLGAVEGIPVIVSEQIALADVDGKITKGGNAEDNGRLLCVNRTQYRVGSKRELLIEVDRDIQKRQTLMVASFRLAFEGRNTNSSDKAVALQFNITFVPA